MYVYDVNENLNDQRKGCKNWKRQQQDIINVPEDRSIIGSRGRMYTLPMGL